MMGMITAECSLSTVVVFCLCALRDGERQPAGALPRVISSAKQFFLLATSHPSASIRNRG